MPASPSPFRIVVVGAGFAGTATTVQLLRDRRAGPLEVTLVERGRDFGPGVAFSTPDAQHLLNVAAAGMSALPHQPAHFLDWLRGRDGTAAATGGTFAPRMHYGAYLRELLDEAERTAGSGVRLTRTTGEAVRVLDAPAGSRATVLLRGGAAVEADAVVLALGVSRPRTPAGADPALGGHPAYVGDPWDHARVGALAACERVLILGSGLTMVDVAMSLSADAAGPRLLAVSRRGALPRSHRAVVPARIGAFRPPSGPLTADRLAAHVETAALAEVAAGGDWRSAVDGVRPYAQQLWQALPLSEQAGFLARHARRWEIHRHRMAPAVGERLGTLRAEGRLELQAGSLQRLTPAGEGIEVAYRTTTGVERLTVDGVVNCTGPDPAPGADGDPLLGALIEDRLARAGPLGLGLDVGPDGQLRDCDGRASTRLFTLGALRRGQLWETTAVPEIRCQAAELAALLSAHGGMRVLDAA